MNRSKFVTSESSEIGSRPHVKIAQKQLIGNRGSARISTVPKPPTILVFDSGLGGLTVLREVVAARPDAHYVYVADDAFFPYGHHGEDEIIARVVPLVGELITAHEPDLVVIACNTASTLVMTHLRAAYTVPFVGTVPAIKPACARSKTRRVSVLGTKGTVKREYTKEADPGFRPGLRGDAGGLAGTGIARRSRTQRRDGR